MRVLSCLAIAAALLVAGAAAQECISTGATVTLVNGKPAAPVNTTTAFDKNGVEQHFESIAPFEDFRPNTGTYFSCVDSRGEYPEFGTPGGDFAELAAATWLYFNMTKQNVTDAAVEDLFLAFMKAIPTKDRPFYYHTSDEKLQKVFHLLEDTTKSLGVPRPTVFPLNMPEEPTLQKAWLEALSTGKNQGCGHMRLMIDQYGDYGYDSADVPKALVKAFFKYWWPTKVHSEERSKVRYQIVQGPLDGRAVVIVDSTGACPGKSPAIPPSHDGSQLFVYHAKAVDEFRKDVLTPFFVKYAKDKGQKLDQTAFYNNLKSLQAKQLNAVLTYLSPANALPVWGVNIKASAGPGGVAPPPTGAQQQNLANPRNAKNSAPAPAPAPVKAAAAPKVAAAAVKPVAKP